MKKLVHLLLILMIACPLVGTIVSSCAGESDCSVAGRAMLWSSVYNIADFTVTAHTLDSLTVTALYTDSTIFPKTKDVTRFGLPLRYTNDTTVWVFHYSRLTRDTIIIRHTNTPKFISMDCGYEMKQSIIDIDYTRHRLDSIRVTSSSTNTDETKNLEIFYR